MFTGFRLFPKLALLQVRHMATSAADILLNQKIKLSD